MDQYYHPDSVHHPDNAWRTKIEAAHLEALEDQARRIRKAINDVLSGTGFALTIDTYDTGGIELEYWAQGAPGPSFDTPLEGPE